MRRDSDARFYGALLDATKDEYRDPDVRLYHFGGKDRIVNIARALRLVQIPVVAVVDIDILADSEKFFVFFEAMGGQRNTIERDVLSLSRAVAQRKGQLTGSELAIELRRLAGECEKINDVPKQVRGKLLELGRDSSNWQRVKHDGFRALDAQIFGRVSSACRSVGLLINPEGELEGFCRSVSRTRKSEWLAEVIRKDFINDPSLADAREFAKIIRQITRVKISSQTGSITPPPERAS